MSSRRELANAIRALSMDAVQKAKSGHPGAPMGMADIAEVLWNDHLKHNPTNPKWADRDRFVLSNGHGSMLIYSLLHLTGYDLEMKQLESFRQLHSQCAGHPEYGYAPGIETTTGPLGQGITNGVGFAMAEKLMADQFNKPGHDIVDHNTYVFLGDGCLMEGVSHEACSLAGTWGLGKLIAFWDDNNISIDGHIDGWYTDDTVKRFEAYQWHVISVDGHDADAINAAIEEAKKVTDKPSLICCKTIIGFGSPNKSGSHDCHGAALGDEEVALTRKELGWEPAPFVIPDEIYAGWDGKEKGSAAEKSWDEKFAAYEAAFPAEAAEFTRRMAGDLPANWKEATDAMIAETNEAAANLASRQASQKTIAALAPVLPEFLGGSADLTGSNLTSCDSFKHVSGKEPGNYISYGVREFGMYAIMNGMSLHGGLIPFGGTFHMFSDYAKSAFRMAALMKIRTIAVLTHDSIGQGEDGPTHQPIENTSAMRLIPNMDVWRPADSTEVAVAWTAAVERMDGPSSLVFSRQGIPGRKHDTADFAAIRKGGYVLSEAKGDAAAIIIGTGSELDLAAKAQEALAAEGINVRVVSMPSTNVFDRQDQAYKDSVLTPGVKRIAVEAGVTDFWRKYVGLEGGVVGIDTFGESAPGGVLMEHFGFTVENVVKTVKEVL
ncbi:transketolase [Bathymodiolus platifrons methanotrophic gill symbiont]|uniref:transketolase n=1 Tax=Bathymodiolus platifrons methanotrophic gill symbiont TaxID=113268 RepID=UPI000B4212FB|nr:transketolase [Bathymodiolus platifrons methanotrophic gill symbiont]MCK5869270.1 transketolase [Methyloprofundus sp.]TXK98422.1 transketolase [Methylococcaceae bacterium CS4]TXL00981.1 transketolase [Methylococcaceae bacterium CS5]TXL07044.1 transketolase [Methylococcaceae bacterium CS1]TXL08327.1 transketolase [Methylococcaceae bacterium CS3]TXL11104.1 transketolase [Methylococcaceae bacterium CS2]